MELVSELAIRHSEWRSLTDVLTSSQTYSVKLHSFRIGLSRLHHRHR